MSGQGNEPQTAGRAGDDGGRPSTSSGGRPATGKRTVTERRRCAIAGPPTGGRDRSAGATPSPSLSACRRNIRHGWMPCRRACRRARRPRRCARSAILICRNWKSWSRRAASGAIDSPPRTHCRRQCRCAASPLDLHPDLHLGLHPDLHNKIVIRDFRATLAAWPR